MDPLRGKLTNVADHEKFEDIREIDRSTTKHLHMPFYVSLAWEVLQSLLKSHGHGHPPPSIFFFKVICFIESDKS